MKIHNVLMVALVAIGSAVLGVWLYTRWIPGPNPEPPATPDQSPALAGRPVLFDSSASASYPDFTASAERSVNAVVHVKTLRKETQGYAENPVYEFFFGPRGYGQPGPVMGSGSGVIISADGYIVTNHHVVEGADEIEVVLNDRSSYKGKLIGSDPTTDIALLQIEASGLTHLSFGQSDQLKVGEWVLAVGNPFNLTSTVTAGIVSAKSRSIGILSTGVNMGIESFIQTDAAVNPGNSGGALVNTRGELVGINTAIASSTGTYAGYSFAVPASIAQKVVTDLRQFGEVQRGLLGVNIREVNQEIQHRLKLDKPDGILVVGVADDGGAREAGIQTDDVIVTVNGTPVKSVPELQERIGQKRPGDKVQIGVIRDGKTKQFTVTLRNIRGTTGMVKEGSKILGATLEEINSNDKKSLRINYGLKIVKLSEGKLRENGVSEGFIITKANRMPVTSVKDFESMIATASEGLFLTGIYPNGRVAYYAINLEE